MARIRSLRTLLCVVVVTASLSAGDAAAADRENMLLMELKDGMVTIEMRPHLAPGHVARIRELVRNGFYDGIVFHRVIEGFMAQTGDPTGTGRGGSGRKLEAEFSDEPHVRGTVSMARSADPDSGDSQFFIVFGAAPYLDNKYTVWGRVIDGMDVVDRIRKGEELRNGIVTDPDRIVRMRVAADVQG